MEGAELSLLRRPCSHLLLLRPLLGWQQGRRQLPAGSLLLLLLPLKLASASLLLPPLLLLLALLLLPLLLKLSSVSPLLLALLLLEAQLWGWPWSLCCRRQHRPLRGVPAEAE